MSTAIDEARRIFEEIEQFESARAELIQIIAENLILKNFMNNIGIAVGVDIYDDDDSDDNDDDREPTLSAFIKKALPVVNEAISQGFEASVVDAASVDSSPACPAPIRGQSKRLPLQPNTTSTMQKTDEKYKTLFTARGTKSKPCQLVLDGSKYNKHFGEANALGTVCDLRPNDPKWENSCMMKPRGKRQGFRNPTDVNRQAWDASCTKQCLVDDSKNVPLEK